MRAATRRLSLLRLPRQRLLRTQNRYFHASTTAWLPRNNPSHTDSDYPKPSSVNGASSTDVQDVIPSAAEDSADKVNARGAAGRRVVRNGKARQGIPPPPPIPGWFLKYNVRNYEEGRQEEAEPAEDVSKLVNDTARSESAGEEQKADLKKFFDPSTPEKDDAATSDQSRQKSDTESRMRQFSKMQLERVRHRISTQEAEMAEELGMLRELTLRQSEQASEAFKVLMEKTKQRNAQRKEESRELRELASQDQSSEVLFEAVGTLHDRLAERSTRWAKEMQEFRELHGIPSDAAQYPGLEEMKEQLKQSSEQYSAEFMKDLTGDREARRAARVQERETTRQKREERLAQLTRTWQEHNSMEMERSTEQPSQRPFGKASEAAKVLEGESPRLSTRAYALLQAQLLVHSIFSLTRAEESNRSLYQTSNLIFRSPDYTSHDQLDHFIESVADLVNASVIRIDANDVAELAGTYIDGGSDGPGSMSNIAYEAYEGAQSVERVVTTITPDGSGAEQSVDRDLADQSRDDQESEPAMGMPFGNLGDIKALLDKSKKFLEQSMDGVRVVGYNIVQPGQNAQNQANDPFRIPGQQQGAASPKSQSPVFEAWQEMKLEALLDNLLSAPHEKQNADLSGIEENFLRQKFGHEHVNLSPRISQSALRKQLKSDLEDLVDESSAATSVLHPGNPSRSFRDDSPLGKSEQGTIIHIRDFDTLQDTAQGEAVIKRLARVVSKRRRDGEKVIIIGTNAASDRGVSSVPGMEDEDDAEFRTIPFPPLALIHSNMSQPARPPLLALSRGSRGGGYRRLQEINLRNIQDMIRLLGVPCEQPLYGSNLIYTSLHHNAPRLGQEALSSAEIQRIVLFANGLRELYIASTESKLNPIHILLACQLLKGIDESMRPLGDMDHNSILSNIQVMDRSSDQAKNKKRESVRPNLEEIKKQCSKHEQRLLSGVVDPQNIKTTFADVHAPKETIEALKTLTTLSLMRPEAFQYGVLANDRLPGLLLYGPPGTGKTMLAKAVAKEAKATVLDVSGAQIYEKYVGEGEKMVKAVFSLAKKLSPCVVFIDEADAIFGSRGQSGNRTTHREIINQFLREWDGMDDHSVFMMVATNRPFDLDDAVLRRLPRRLLVDLPVAKDRESILGIHLKGEALDEAVSVNKLAEQTPFYSGSDLKNLCVAAALAAVREENEALLDHKDDKEFKLPEKRTLTTAHFDKAIQEISASISEDMSSLSAIKKFDEQYGDRRGRRKKAGYGFGGLGAVDENSVRVRGDQQPRP